MRKIYRVIVVDSFNQHEHETTNKDAIKAAYRFGRTNDIVTVYDGDKVVGIAYWGLGSKRYSRAKIIEPETVERTER